MEVCFDRLKVTTVPENGDILPIAPSLDRPLFSEDQMAFEWLVRPGVPNPSEPVSWFVEISASPDFGERSVALSQHASSAQSAPMPSWDIDEWTSPMALVCVLDRDRISRLAGSLIAGSADRLWWRAVLRSCQSSSRGRPRAIRSSAPVRFAIASRDRP